MVRDKHSIDELNSLVKTYDIDNEYEQFKRLEVINKLYDYFCISDACILELGCASGRMTRILASMSSLVVAVDGSSEFIDIAKKNNAGVVNVRFVESLFSDFETQDKFDCVLMHHILEHLEKPEILLDDVKRFIGRDGIIVVTVPNANALSRQLAVKMGLLSSVYELTDNDRNHGHYRVYDWPSLEKQVVDAGFTIIGRHGLSFKLLSDRQNNEMLRHNIIGEEQAKGLWLLGDEMPELAGAIMIVAKKSQIK